MGQTLGGMLAGPLVSREEKDCEKWLHSPLLGNGLEDRDPERGEEKRFRSHIRLKEGSVWRLCYGPPFNPLTPSMKLWKIQSFLTFDSMDRTLLCDHSLESC